MGLWMRREESEAALKGANCSRLRYLTSPTATLSLVRGSDAQRKSLREIRDTGKKRRLDS